MSIIQLLHYKKLGYAAPHELPQLSLLENYDPENTLVLTFRENKDHLPNIIRKDIHACTRFLDVPHSLHLTLAGIESDSSLAPLILWDIVHTFPIGTQIITTGLGNKTSYLESFYFNEALKIISHDEHQKTFQKIKKLPVEQAAGLTRWSFGIPVGPDDAAALNAVVKRILELDVPEKEIILCGRPGDNFHYWDQVRIVGEDIPGSPVRICMKKNALARAAKYENLCILHDRIFLPQDFYKSIQRFGDFFPFVTLQSLYFDDKNNFVPKRYSDYHTPLGNLDQTLHSINKKGEISIFSPSSMSFLDQICYLPGNVLRYNGQSHQTGSLYITKKALWDFCPQNDSLHWTEYEDVEHVHRAFSQGILSRVNPYSFTQSIFARLLISSPFGTQHVESAIGGEKKFRLIAQFFIRSKKPAFKISKLMANKKLNEFADRYIPPSILSSLRYHLNKLPLNTQDWIQQVGMVIKLAKLERNEFSVKQFILDIEKMIAFDQIPYITRNVFIDQFRLQGTQAKTYLFEHGWVWLTQYYVRPNKWLFYNSLRDFFVPRNKKTLLGSLFSAFTLNNKNGDFFYHPDGVKGYYNAILNSTPYVDYLEKMEPENENNRN